MAKGKVKETKETKPPARAKGDDVTAKAKPARPWTGAGGWLAGVAAPARGGEQHRDALGRGVHREVLAAARLEDHLRLVRRAVGRHAVDALGADARREREVVAAIVADGHRVRPARRLDHHPKGVARRVAHAHVHLARGAVGPVPQLGRLGLG